MKTSFDPKRDIPDLANKVVLVTGGTAGIGRQTVLLLAQHNPSHIFITGRTRRTAEQTISSARAVVPSVPVTFIQLDQASLATVRAGAASFLAQSPARRLDLLFCNSGIMCTPPGLTADGYEVQFGTNHVGHALLVELLLPAMRATARLPGVAPGSVRVVVSSSRGYGGHPGGGVRFDELNTTQEGLWPLGGWQRYGQSKLANVLYARALAEREAESGVVAVSLHPGVALTGLVDQMGWGNRAFVRVANVGQIVSPEEACWNQVWCAVSGDVVSGKYYEPVGVDTKPMRMGADEELKEKLWDWTRAELSQWVEGFEDEIRDGN